MAPTLAQLAKLNSGLGGILVEQIEVTPGAYPAPPAAGWDGYDISVAHLSLVGIRLREDPIRYTAYITPEDPPDDSASYKVDVDGVTATATTDSSATLAELLGELQWNLCGLDKPFLPTQVDEDGDGTKDTIKLEGHHWKISVSSVSNTTTYSLVVSQGSEEWTVSYDSDSDATEEEIVQGVVAAANASDAPVEAYERDSTGNGTVDVLYVGPTEPGVDLGSYGNLTEDAAGSSAAVTIEDGGSDAGADMTFVVDATTVTFEVWGRIDLDDGTSQWCEINSLEGLTKTSTWVENLRALSYFDGGFIRVTDCDGRVVPFWVPAKGA